MATHKNHDEWATEEGPACNYGEGRAARASVHERGGGEQDQAFVRACLFRHAAQVHNLAGSDP